MLLPSAPIRSSKSSRIGFEAKIQYDQDLEFAHLVKCITALSFVPPDDVEALFERLSEEFPEEDTANQLLSYFKSTNIQGPILRRRRKPAMFPITLWNHYQDALDKAPKATNCTEGWHNSLRAIFL